MFVTIIQLILITMGGVSGFELMQTYGTGLFPVSVFIGMSVLAVLIGCGIGFVMGGVGGRFLLDTLNNATVQFQKLPTADLILAIVGLLAGLIIAALLSQIFLNIESIGIYLSVLSYVIFGYLGIQLALRKRGDLSAMVTSIDPTMKVAKKPLLKEAVLASDKIVDTSVIIDSRIIDISKTRFLEGRLLVPIFVLNELHTLADSEDPIKRNRGRKGLLALDQLQQEKEIELQILDRDYSQPREVDGKLVKLALETHSYILTTDYNLNKVAKLQGARVLNINDLANALKPVVLPGERLKVKVIKEGKEYGQGVAYLDDGTMIVVEDGKHYLGRTVEGVVTSVLQTPAGRMIFVRVQGARISTA